MKERKELLLGYFGDGCRRVEGVFQESLGEKHFSSGSLEGKNGKRASPAS